MENSQVIIIGGGLAGLTAAVHLSKLGHSVIVIERNQYPKHRVCGEYISNEILPYLNWLNINVSELHPTIISTLSFSTLAGKNIEASLPLGGFGISRYALDNFIYKKALANGCQFVHETAETIVFERDIFTITTSGGRQFKSAIVLGAFGKRSNVDQKMQRDFIRKKSPWLAVKGHYKGTFPDTVVGLHNFKGGYCGVSKVENGIINICYLADYTSFKKYKNTEDFQANVLMQNPNLESIFNNAQLLFEKPLTISQISFEQKAAVENHILMIGDTAGLIHPLCGNGMAMAIHSAKIASGLVSKYLKNELPSRQFLEQSYGIEWNYNFKKRLRMGRMLSTLFQKPKLSEALLRVVAAFPFLLPHLINQTHGKPITLEECS